MKFRRLAGAHIGKATKKISATTNSKKIPNVEQRTQIINSIIEKLIPNLLLPETVEPLLQDLFGTKFSPPELEAKIETAKKRIEASIVDRASIFALIGSSDLKQITEYGRVCMQKWMHF